MRIWPRAGARLGEGMDQGKGPEMAATSGELGAEDVFGERGHQLSGLLAVKQVDVDASRALDGDGFRQVVALLLGRGDVERPR